MTPAYSHVNITPANSHVYLTHAYSHVNLTFDDSHMNMTSANSHVQFCKFTCEYDFCKFTCEYDPPAYSRVCMTPEYSHMNMISRNSHVNLTPAYSHVNITPASSHVHLTHSYSHVNLTFDDSHMNMTSANSHVNLNPADSRELIFADPDNNVRFNACVWRCTRENCGRLRLIFQTVICATWLFLWIWHQIFICLHICWVWRDPRLTWSYSREYDMCNSLKVALSLFIKLNGAGTSTSRRPDLCCTLTTRQGPYNLCEIPIYYPKYNLRFNFVNNMIWDSHDNKIACISYM